MRSTITDERAATAPEAAHDASRAFHMSLACATQNDEAFRVMDSLWIADISRHRMVERIIGPGWPMWKETDASEHAAILEAVTAKDPDMPQALVRRHVEEALRLWRETELSATRED